MDPLMNPGFNSNSCFLWIIRPATGLKLLLQYSTAFSLNQSCNVTHNVNVQSIFCADAQTVQHATHKRGVKTEAVVPKRMKT